MHRLSNAWRLSKASWQVLSEDRRMIGIPVLAALGALVAFAFIAGPGLLMLGSGDTSASDLAGWIFVALGTVAASWVVACGQATIIVAAAEIMDGEPPRLRAAIATARRRSLRLLEWALLATGVALVLDQIEQRFGVVGRIVSWLGNAAFAVLSFLALPVIVFEDLGAIAAFKRSAMLLKQTWGEQVSFSFGMGLLTFVLVLPAAFMGMLGWSTGLLPLQIFGVAASAGTIGLLLALTAALSAIFKTALYRYAIGAPVDHAFSDADLAGAFEPSEPSARRSLPGFATGTPIPALAGATTTSSSASSATDISAVATLGDVTTEPALFTDPPSATTATALLDNPKDPTPTPDPDVTATLLDKAAEATPTADPEVTTVVLDAAPSERAVVPTVVDATDKPSKPKRTSKTTGIEGQRTRRADRPPTSPTGEGQVVDDSPVAESSAVEATADGAASGEDAADSVTSSDVPRLVNMVDEIVESAKAAKSTKATKTARARKAAKAAKIPEVTETLGTSKAAKAAKATKSAKAAKVKTAAKATKAAKAAKKATKAAKAAKAAKATKATKAKKAAKPRKAAGPS